MIRSEPRFLLLSMIALAGSLSATVAGCSDDVTTAATGPTGAGGGGGSGAGTGGSVGKGGAAGGAGTAGGAGNEPQPGPGEVCNEPQPEHVLIHPSMATIFVAPGKTRTVTLTLEPDFCHTTPVALSLDNANAAIGATDSAVPTKGEAQKQTATIDLKHIVIKVDIVGKAVGSANLKVAVGLDGVKEVLVPIQVLDPAVAACSGTTSGKVTAGGKIGGGADVLGAELGLQANADNPAQATEMGFTYKTPVVWAVQPFDATLACSPSIVPSSLVPVGAAITTGPTGKSFPRELPMAIPINPAAFPDKGRLRHLKVVYSGPSFKAPRSIAVADPRIEQGDNGGWVLRFMAPRLGTYQAAMAPDAGTKVTKRRVTHRGIMGVSMGGGGTAIFGLRHHDKFDAMAPLGGPVDWSWMMDHIEHNHTGGFMPNDGTNVPTALLPLPTPKDVYEHPSTFNQWWYEYPRNGNGGGFGRDEYTQIFRDLALMWGNPNSDNASPDGLQLPAGVDPMSKSVVGDHPGKQCGVWVDPIDGDPTVAMEKDLSDNCPTERCAHPDSFSKYYDAEFNSKGTWPVITVCDGSPQNKQLSPYANTWSPTGNNRPLEVALAVDYNGNGVRDENEPVLRQGHERWKDVGTDGKASVDEPGYQKGVDEDPAGDDYHPQYNPNGTEGDTRFQAGEPYADDGLDGVPNTKASPYDTGEGDGKFTVSKGLQRFWDQDTRSIIHQWNAPPGGPMDDAALARVDVWTDGGVRDLFNFDVDAQHLMGSMASRGRDVHYYTDFSHLPGQKWGDKNNFLPQEMRWEELPGAVMMRYGSIDPTVQDLIDGSGQHVGAVPDLAARLQSALYFMGRRWPDAPRTFVEESSTDPVEGVDICQVHGNCDFSFTDSRGRIGPVTVTLPPGYVNKSQKDVRYPVIYLLHGYGQGPKDLSAAIAFLRNWMNSGIDSYSTRLPKAIVVYVDGRCRLGPTGEAECIRGTFYVDSPRATGAKQESWFLELMEHVDKTYRTMPETILDSEE